MLSSAIFVGALLFPTIYAQAPTRLSQAEIDTYDRYTHYAAAIFCRADVLKDWTCGSRYIPNPDSRPYGSWESHWRKCYNESVWIRAL